MNASYVIVPSVLLSMFFGYERHFQRQREVRERARAEIVAAEQAQQDEARAKQILVARRDTEQRAADRERQEREKAEQKRSAFDQLMTVLKVQTDEQSTQAEKLSQEVDRLSTRIHDLRARQAGIEQDAIELRQKLALKSTSRRNAELEVQRVTGMIATRLNESL